MRRRALRRRLVGAAPRHLREGRRREGDRERETGRRRREGDRERETGRRRR